MKHLLITSILVFIALTSFSQKGTIKPTFRKFKNDTIVWKTDSLLRKEDFKSRPKPNGPLGFAATGILIYPSESGGELIFYVEALFVKSKSYVTKFSEYVLRHEQLHFDITELYARKLRKKMMETDFKKVKKLQNEIQNLFNNYSEQLQKAQNKYDTETEHGLNSARQAVWNEDIQRQIKELDDFKSPAIDIAK